MTARPSNKEEEIASSSLSVILVALVDAVDRLALAIKGRNHPLPYLSSQSPVEIHEPANEVAASPPPSEETLPVPLVSGAPSATQTAQTSSVSLAVGPATPTVASQSPTPLAMHVSETTPAPAEVSSGSSLPTAPAMASAGPSSTLHIPTPDEVRSRFHEMPSTASKTWFVVTRGRLPGVYATWMETSPLVTGVSRAVYNRFPSKEEALAVYGAAWASGHVARLSY
ncbi:hypothetical protein F5887DRAFT_1083295 [Amanita rubescens]|nr:hypothetical protein F5887DRAFT_1083295 [Amanita rubescens]